VSNLVEQFAARIRLESEADRTQHEAGIQDKLLDVGC
jgi:hypothetical protein